VVCLRECKVLFVSLMASMAIIHVVNESVKIMNGVGGISTSVTLEVCLGVSVAGAILIYLFASFMLKGATRRVSRPIVLDVPAHLAYSLGVLDRTEEARAELQIH
jgi:Na+/H+-translocating membrane pyrophosphatase